MKLNIKQKRYNTTRIKDIKIGNVFKDTAANAYLIKTDAAEHGDRIICVDIQNGMLLYFDKDTTIEPVEAEVKIEEY